MVAAGLTEKSIKAHICSRNIRLVAVSAEDEDGGSAEDDTEQSLLQPHLLLPSPHCGALCLDQRVLTAR